MAYPKGDVLSSGVVLHHRATTAGFDLQPSASRAAAHLDSTLAVRAFVEWSHYTQVVQVVPQMTVSALLTSMAALGSLVFTVVRLLSRAADKASTSTSSGSAHAGAGGGWREGQSPRAEKFGPDLSAPLLVEMGDIDGGGAAAPGAGAASEVDDKSF